MQLPDNIQELKDLVTLVLTRLEQLEQENALLKVENAQLKEENAELRRRLDLRSHNSHKPPSSDGLSKKPGIPKESGKKTGGQFGNPGKTLKMVEQADEIVIHHAHRCRHCKREFDVSEVEQIVDTRQVFDIPAPRLEVTEHQVGAITCCGAKQVGEFPPGVRNVVQYGSRIKALSVLLNTDYRLPLEKIEKLFTDLYNCSFNQSTVITANERCYERLEPIEKQIADQIKQSQVVNYDETGGRVENKLHWFHVACTSLWTYLFVDQKRGKQALQGEQSLIKDFHNWAVHDCWESYFGFDECRHAICNAHILRELENLKEQGREWAGQMKQLLLEMYELSEHATKVLAHRKQWEKKYEKICQQADREEPKPEKSSRGKPKNSVGRNLLKRLKKHQVGVLAFAFEEEVPFTNNQAERDLRCLKVKQKVSNTFRTLSGAENYARIQGFISTIRKHKLNVFEELINVFDGNSIIFQTSK